jgi:RNA polymerase sigma-70 factor, ECF subfamily
LTDPETIERFQSLYTRHQGQVYAYAVSRAGRQLADEVVSEVFLIAWRRRADVPALALPWLLGVARNVITGQFRESARQRSLAAELRAWVTEQELSAGDVADEVSERIAVLAALAGLPDPDRELLTLVAWHGLTPREAARVVGCSTAAYFVRLHRARRRLERAMADGAAPDRAGAAGDAGGRGLTTLLGPPRPASPPRRAQPPSGDALTGSEAPSGGALTGGHAPAGRHPHPALTQRQERML